MQWLNEFCSHVTWIGHILENELFSGLVIFIAQIPAGKNETDNNFSREFMSPFTDDAFPTEKKPYFFQRKVSEKLQSKLGSQKCGRVGTVGR